MMELHFSPLEESHAVSVAINLCYSHWFIPTAVLLVYGSVEGVQQLQHGQLPELSSIVSRSPAVLGLQTRPGSMFNEDSDCFSVSCRYYGTKQDF